MSGINRSKIAKRILNSLVKKDLMKPIIIYRNGKNVFNETQEKQYVTTVQGFYHKDKSKLNLNFSDGGTVNTGYSEKLLVVYNEESKRIKKDDYFLLKDEKYTIIDTGNIEDIVFDMTINRK